MISNDCPNPNPALADPTKQNLFVQPAPNALHPCFKYKASKNEDCYAGNAIYNISIKQAFHQTGLIDNAGNLLTTPIWGYGSKDDDSSLQVSWPGKTFEVESNKPITVNWNNCLTDDCGNPLPHILPVDESLHWSYSLHGYENISIATDGVPLVPHLHGGHNNTDADGNPEYFVGTTEASRGPRWISNSYYYDNSQCAGTLWYHDHSLGITRLNVYAGLAGFYIIRDEKDTGKHDNPLALPAEQYEFAYCIQDRMFRETGELFFPAFKGDPAWDDFIVDEGANPPNPKGPSALAEFFGDHILVNGKLWPKANVEPRHYRLRLLNGCDSRFMRLRFRMVPAGVTDLTNASAPLEFDVIGSDQGLLRQVATVTEVDFIPGERVDIVFDFRSVPLGSRVIIENILGDAPFTGELSTPGDLFPNRSTDRVIAFDVTLELNSETDGYCGDGVYSEIQDRYDRQLINGIYQGVTPDAVCTRRMGLYEGKDEYGRLMPMLGTVESVIDVEGGNVNGAMVWFNPITENPNDGDTEIWEIYNATGDAHPIHVHLVHFEILSRSKFEADSIEQSIITHSGGVGKGFRLENIVVDPVEIPALATEDGPKDMVLCYPAQVTRIKMTFDKPGRYVWHCHILSHEDHEMMRPLHVGHGPF